MLVLETTKMWYKYINYFKNIWKYHLSILFEEYDIWYKKAFNIAEKAWLQPELAAEAE